MVVITCVVTQYNLVSIEKMYIHTRFKLIGIMTSNVLKHRGATSSCVLVQISHCKEVHARADGKYISKG